MHGEPARRSRQAGAGRGSRGARAGRRPGAAAGGGRPTASTMSAATPRRAVLDDAKSSSPSRSTVERRGRRARRPLVSANPSRIPASTSREDVPAPSRSASGSGAAATASDAQPCRAPLGRSCAAPPVTSARSCCSAARSKPGGRATRRQEVGLIARTTPRRSSAPRTPTSSACSAPQVTTVRPGLVVPDDVDGVAAPRARGVGAVEAARPVPDVLVDCARSGSCRPM